MTQTLTAILLFAGCATGVFDTWRWSSATAELDGCGQQHSRSMYCTCAPLRVESTTLVKKCFEQRCPKVQRLLRAIDENASVRYVERDITESGPQEEYSTGYT
jgi:hypothetical protein